MVNITLYFVFTNNICAMFSREKSQFYLRASFGKQLMKHYFEPFVYFNNEVTETVNVVNIFKNKQRPKLTM